MTEVTKTIKCDRCGAEIKDKPNLFHSLGLPVYIRHNTEDSDKQVDLCPDCLDAFKRFWLIKRDIIDINAILKTYKVRYKYSYQGSCMGAPSETGGWREVNNVTSIGMCTKRGSYLAMLLKKGGYDMPLRESALSAIEVCDSTGCWYRIKDEDDPHPIVSRRFCPKGSC